MNKTSIALVAGVVLALAGCGGGGGDSEAKALVPLSTSNYDAVADDVVASLGGTGPIFDAFDGFDDYEDLQAESGSGSAMSPYAVLGTGQMGPIAAFALKRVGAAQAMRETAQGVSSSLSPDCLPGGSLLVTVNDADNNGDASAGDTVTLDATQCVFGSGQPAVSGRLTIRVNGIAYGAGGIVASASVGLTFTGFTVGDVSLDGSATASSSGDTVTLAYRNLTARQGGQSLVYNYTLVASNSGLRADGLITFNGSTYGMSTPQLITFGSVYPNGGLLKITDGHGAYALSNFQSAGYVNQLYLAGDNVVDAQSGLHLWTDPV